MKFIIFLGMAIVEYIIITIVTSRISKMKEYITINYDVFRFKKIGERKCGLNILISIIFPLIYTTICAGILYKLNYDNYVEHIYIVNILYFFIRWIMISFVFEWKILNDWKSEIIEFIVCNILNILLYYFFIIKTKDIFVSIDELKKAIWIGIITFIFVVIRDYVYDNIKINNMNSEERKRKYILVKYNKFKSRYGYIIDTEDQILKKIVYAIMIYENYSRPRIIRKLEYIIFFIKGEASLGIMQFKTSDYINDEESVKRGYFKIKNQYEKLKKELADEEIEVNKNNKRYKNKVIMRTILNYNDSYKYYEEVNYIMSVINSI